MADVLVVDSLVRRFGDLTAVDEVSFRIAPGETYGLLGPNGAGKTTTISMVAGLIAAHAGTVTVAGQAMTTRTTEPKKHLGLVPQELAIYPDLSGRENLALFGRLQGLRKPELRARVDEVLELIGLADRAKDRSKEYSGGMKRRLNIGIGLLNRPTLLILDEPTVGVDPQSRNAILESVEALSVEGMAVLYTTHYMERPSGSATASASSTPGGCRPRAPVTSWSGSPAAPTRSGSVAAATSRAPLTSCASSPASSASTPNDARRR